jgi:lipopolysaccharide/colanic/teichoic acid biosynthesis glycosyltransferase
VTPTHPAQTLTVRPLGAVSGLKSVYRAEQIFAVLAIIALIPLILAIAMTIFILSRRSPLVRHSRIGQNGAPLPLLKFRTMWNPLEAPPRLFNALFEIEDISRNALGVKNGTDARVSSRFATLCRRHSLDEIPQLYHVARGEMSLVGPRPLTAAELAAWYGPAAATVLHLRPGLTGLWQIKGRNRLTYPQRRRLDIFLARRASAGLYFLILLRTIPKVLQGTGAW